MPSHTLAVAAALLFVMPAAASAQHALRPALTFPPETGRRSFGGSRPA